MGLLLRQKNGISRLDLIILVFIAAIGVMIIIPVFRKPADVLIKQAHRTERYKYTSRVELHAMDNDGFYPPSMKPRDWLEFEKYFPELKETSVNVDEPLYCNQGASWEINPDHKLSLLGHGNHE